MKAHHLILKVRTPLEPPKPTRATKRDISTLIYKMSSYSTAKAAPKSVKTSLNIVMVIEILGRKNYPMSVFSSKL